METNRSWCSPPTGLQQHCVPVCPVCLCLCPQAALNMLSCCFALELKSQKTLVMALHPGWVKTQMGGDKVRLRGRSAPPDVTGVLTIINHVCVCVCQAPLSPHDSVQGMINVMSSLSSKDTGSFMDWNGEVLPW